jgi:tetratricopeptide (TPR) repeat protein
MKKVVFLILICLCIKGSMVAQVSETELLNNARKSLQQKNFKAAYTMAQQLNTASPNNNEYMMLKADCAFEQGYDKESIELYEAISSSNKNAFKAQYKLMLLYVRNKRYNDAIALNTQLKAKQLNDAEQLDVANALGKAAYEVENYPLCIKTLESLGNKATSQQYKMIADSYAGLEQYDNALPNYEKVWQLDSNNHKACYKLAIEYYNAQKFGKALEFLQKSEIKGFKPDKDFYYLIASIQYDRHDYASAILALEKAQKLSPYDQAIASLTAYSYYNKGDQKNARKIIDAMLELNPNNADLIYLYGLTYQKDDNMTKAEKYFDRAIKLKPSLELNRVSKFKF